MSETTGNGRPDEIDGGDGERLVHRHHEVAGPVDAALAAERLEDGLPERDADVLHGVVGVDVEIAGRGNRQIEAAVTRDELEHVIEEADARAHGVAAPSVEVDRQTDVRLGGSSVNSGATQGRPPWR